MWLFWFLSTVHQQLQVEHENVVTEYEQLLQAYQAMDEHKVSLYVQRCHLCEFSLFIFVNYYFAD